MIRLLEQETRNWFMEGVARGAAYLIMVHDNCEQIWRPLFVYPDQNVQHEVMRIVGDMRFRMGSVLTLTEDMESQVMFAVSTNVVVSRIEN
jgi:hypothetical protein